MNEPVVIIGIDLAWGEKNPDGVTILTFDKGIDRPASAMATGLTRGDRSPPSPLYRGTRSEVLGDDETGHMLIPRL